MWKKFLKLTEKKSTISICAAVFCTVFTFVCGSNNFFQSLAAYTAGAASAISYIIWDLEDD